MTRYGYLSFVLMAGLSVSAFAQQNQAEGLNALYSDGLGPQSLGVAPGRTFLSIYGTLDLGVDYSNAGGKAVTRLESGNVWASKLGFYGQEDLGSGWISFFRLEAGFNADNGTQQDTTSLFSRASIVGLQNQNFGQLTLGRQFSSVGAAGVGADSFLGNAHESIFVYMATASDLGGGGNNAIGSRLNNTIRYATPAIAEHVTADVSVSFKQNSSGGHDVHAQTGSLTYLGNGTSLGAGYGQAWCDPSVPAECANTKTVTPTIRTDTMIASAQHDFGPFVGNLAYVRVAPKGAGSAIANVFNVGVEKIVGVNFYRASFAYRNTTITNDYAFGTTLGVDHFLSRTTALYARVGVLKNGAKSSLFYNYDTTSSNVLPAQGSTARDVSVGIYHNF